MTTEADLIYIHNFDDLPGDLPPTARILDWSAYFARSPLPRKAPAPAMWQDILIPQLRQLRTELGRRGLIRLRTTGALSVGFAFGQTFQEIGQYCLEVVQSASVPPLLWRSDEASPVGRETVRFASHLLPGHPGMPDGLVVVYAVPGRSFASTVEAVGGYFGEADTFKTFLTGKNSQGSYNIRAIRQLLADGFDEDQLRTLCFDSYEFQPVHTRLTETTNKATIIQYLVEFAAQQVLFEELLSLIKDRNPRRYMLAEADLRQVGTPSQKFKGVLLLEAEAASKEERFIEGWEAAALARTSRRLLVDFVNQVKPKKLHLFLAVPFGLAVFLGHQWNAVGLPVQCYEWIGGDQPYTPSCLLDLS